MTYFRAGTRLNFRINSILLVLFCLMQAQWFPMTASTHGSMQWACGMACHRSSVHRRVAHSSVSHCEGHQIKMLADDCSISCDCCRTVPQVMLTIPEAVLAGDFSLQVPDAYCENLSLKCIYVLSGFPRLPLRPPTVAPSL